MARPRPDAVPGHLRGPGDGSAVSGREQRQAQRRAHQTAVRHATIALASVLLVIVALGSAIAGVGMLASSSARSTTSAGEKRATVAAALWPVDVATWPVTSASSAVMVLNAGGSWDRARPIESTHVYDDCRGVYDRWRGDEHREWLRARRLEAGCATPTPPSGFLNVAGSRQHSLADSATPRLTDYIGSVNGRPLPGGAD